MFDCDFTFAGAPAAFGVGDWSAAPGADNEIDITITSLPSGATAIKYRVDGGTSQLAPGTTDFTITAPAGSRTVELAASNLSGDSAWSDVKNVTVTGSSATATITEKSDSENVAPFAAWFDVAVTGGPVSDGAGTYRDTLHEYEYRWTFAGVSANFAANELPTIFDDPSTATGWQVARVFETAGTHAVTCSVYHNGTLIATDSINVVVQDPDTAYSGTRTIAVALDSDFTGAPSGAQQVTTIAAAETALEALGQTGRILLKRGETYANANIDITTSMDNFRMGAWGSGAKPILTPVPITARGTGSTNEIFQFLNAATLTDFMIYDLDMRGDWDPTTESGDPRSEPLYWLTHTGGTDTMYGVHNCEFSNFAKVKFGNISRTDDFTVIFSNSNMTGWQDYGYFGHGPIAGANTTRCAFVGCSSRQDVDACQGPEGGALGKDGFTNDHGPFRTSVWDKTIIEACTFFSCNGWSGGSAGRTAAQAPIRINTEGDLGAEWCLTRVAAEGGAEIIDADTASPSRPTNPMNWIIENAVFAASAQTTTGMIFGMSGFSMRNAIWVRPNLGYESVGSTFISYSIPNAQNNVEDEPIRIHNCTFLNLDTTAWSVEGGGDLSSFTDRTVENNVHHAPNQSGPVTTDAPIDLSTAFGGMSLVYKGKRASTDRVSITNTSLANSATTAQQSYPSGLGQSDFDTTGPHALISAGEGYYFRDSGDFTVTLNAGGFTITNTSGAAITGDLTVNLVRNNFTTDGATSSVGVTLPLARQQSGSAAIDDAGSGLVIYQDIAGNARSGTPDSGAWEGT